jgi:hypothetical protein
VRLAVAAGFAVQWCGAGECSFFEREVGVDVHLRGFDLFVSEPERDHGGVVPACRRRIAAVWRRACGVIVFVVRDGQRGAAWVACWVIRRASALRVSGLPVLVGNSGSVAGCRVRRATRGVWRRSVWSVG